MNQPVQGWLEIFCPQALKAKQGGTRRLRPRAFRLKGIHQQ
jgi:hypothetical protein